MSKEEIVKKYPFLTTYENNEGFINRVLGHHEAELSLWGFSEVPVEKLVNKFLEETYGKVIPREMNVGFRISAATHSRVIGIVPPLFLEPIDDEDLAQVLRKVQQHVSELRRFEVGYAFLSSFKLPFPDAANELYISHFFGNIRNKENPVACGFTRYPLEPRVNYSEAAK